MHLVPPLPDNVVRLPQTIPQRIRSQWPSLLVQALVLLSVGLVFVDFRLCVGMLAASIAVAFTLRLTLPKRRIGWLEVRRRRTDLICLGALLVAVVLVALATPTGP